FVIPNALFVSFVDFNLVVDIKCDGTPVFYSIRCISRRPGSLRVDAFRGHGLSLLEKTTLRGLRTRAIPAGVTTLHLPGLMKWLDANFCTRTTIANGSKCKTSEGNTRRLLGGEKASARPRSALARGGSPAAPGKRSVFP